MREIKFRVWDKDTRRMYKNDSDLKISIENNGGYIFAHNANVVIPPEYIELMQYTGLKDKYGKEIYEGDIVTCLRDGDEQYIECVVVYDIRNLPRALFGSILISREVIGNIYENPELLNQY